ncbi:MAG: hypothetical protein LBQ98_01115 [Nitrososphaerota archaeon]|jgi:hypothetical protein|nr:hypothetical protein [Nitrososphaerota archaeon]
MELPKTLKNCIRGWLPKESDPLSRNPKAEQTSINQKITLISVKIVGGLALGTGTFAFFLLTAPYYLFPELYVPKSNPNLGYTAPNSTTSWIVLAVAIGLLFLAIILLTLFIMKMNYKDTQGGDAGWNTSKHTHNAEYKNLTLEGNIHEK